MAYYGKTPKQMLVDLINQANPAMPFPIDAVNFDFLNIKTITTTPDGHNTSVAVVAKPSSPYLGSVVVTYRRLDIANVFKNVTPAVQRWVPNSGALNGTVIATSDSLLPIYAAKYGLPLDPADWTSVNLTTYNGIRGDTWNLAAAANNLCFIGSVPAKWTIGERTLDSLLPVSEIAGRIYPDGNDFTKPQRYWVQPDGFNVDYTANRAIFEASYFSGALISDNRYGFYSAIAPFVDQVLPQVSMRDGTKFLATKLTNNLTGYKTTPFSLDGCKVTRYRLPDATLPEANSEFYNSVVVLEIPADCTWGVGKLYFHYNN